MDNTNLNKFITFRNKLIERLDNKEITKLEFIFKNYEYLNKLNVKPYGEINNVSEGVLAYQYFNSYAKYLLTKAFEVELREPEIAYELREDAFENYGFKNHVIKELLDIIEYTNVEAFFINMDSKALEGELFEIVFKDYEKMIFHTKDKLILNRLKRNDCFTDGIKDSLIDSYINKKY